LISSIPLDIIVAYSVSGFDSTGLKLTKLLRFVRLAKIAKFLQRHDLNRYQTAGLVMLSYLSIPLSCEM
jgi:hypothetical protein